MNAGDEVQGKRERRIQKACPGQDAYGRWMEGPHRILNASYRGRGLTTLQQLNAQLLT